MTTVTLSPKQQSYIAHSDAFMNIADGAVRSGKTYSALMRFYELCKTGPPGEFVVVGKTERTAKRNVVNPLAQMRPDVRYIQGAGELYVGKRLCHVIGANDLKAEEKARGLTAASSYSNEITLYPESFVKTLIDRHSVDGAIMLGDCNPDSPYHYLNQDYLEAGHALEFLKRWRFQLADNPILSKRYLDSLLAAHPPGTLWHKRMILGLWVVAEGAVYEQWIDDHTSRSHVVRGIPGGLAAIERVVVGVDYGTSNATVFVALGLVRGTWYAFAEWVHDGRKDGQRTDSDYATSMVHFLERLPVAPISIEVDPSAASFKAALRDIGVRRVRDADNSVVDGIRTVSAALSTGRLKILATCERLRREFPSYAWDSKAQEKRGEDKPLKENAEDHALDALRYAVMRVLRNVGVQARRKPQGM
jgi:PBSX family phage terminase large subunit